MPGAGGTESQDWANMLQRMYARWAERRKYKVEIVEWSDGEEAGIKGATLLIKGHNAYGWLKTESGVHRLVRISPYDSSARRHTSFASVWVYPVIDDRIEIEIKESDCRIDTYRSSGAGGQHVNTTDSAVRITHIPTGIVVACQQERSQHKNRATAWNMLRARLYEAELKKREEKANAEAAAKTDIGWGHQIRSLRAAALPAGEGPAHRHPVHRSRRRCSTATSTRSWKPRWRSASTAGTRRSRTSTEFSWPGDRGRIPRVSLPLRGAATRIGSGTRRCQRRLWPMRPLCSFQKPDSRLLTRP